MFGNENPRQWNHRVALYGIGGVRKTQTSLAYTYANRSKHDSVFWISAVNQGALLSGVQQIAEIIHLKDEISKQAEMAMCVLDWLEQDMNWLLIITWMTFQL
jgi:hypothetical protein